MRKPTRTVATLAMTPFLVFGGNAVARDEFHVGVVTNATAQVGSDLQGAEQLVKEYGAAKDKGILQHIVLRDDSLAHRETVISNVVSLANDPLMRAIVVSPAIPGTTEAFKRIRAKRSDILLLAGEAQEDARIIEPVASLVINADYVSRGYTLVWGAKQLGAKTFVHISFPRHMAIEFLRRGRAVMREAARDLGLGFAIETAPDPESGAGTAGAQQFIQEMIPQWVQKYGKETAFFCTHTVHNEVLNKQLPSSDGMIANADVAVPLMSIPGTLAIPEEEKGNFAAIEERIKAAMSKKGSYGELRGWAGGFGFTTSAGLGTFAIQVIREEAKMSSIQDLVTAFTKYTPGAKWNTRYALDARTGIEVKNHLLLYMDTLVFGRDNQLISPPRVPEKYYTIAIGSR